MIDIEELKLKCNAFKIEEKRGNFYDMAVDLMNKGLEIPAMIIILATWNVGEFRYKVATFDLNEFKEVFDRCIPIFNRLKEKKFDTMESIDEIVDDAKEIYNLLSQLEGVKYTGASKIMHLKNRNLFVMWDRYIRGEMPYKYYKNLEIVNRGYWKFKKYSKNAEGYIQFLNDMKEMFKDVKWGARDRIFFEDKTFVKAIIVIFH